MLLVQKSLAGPFLPSTPTLKQLSAGSLPAWVAVLRNEGCGTDAGILLRVMGAVAAFNGSGTKPLALLCVSPHPELKHFVKAFNASANGGGRGENAPWKVTLTHVNFL